MAGIKIGYTTFVLPYDTGMALFKLLAEGEIEELEGYGADVQIKMTDKEFSLELIQPQRYALGKMNKTLKV